MRSHAHPSAEVDLEETRNYQPLPCAWWVQDPPDWQEILNHWRGSELQNYFTRILEDDLQAIIKPQYVDNIPKAVR